MLVDTYQSSVQRKGNLEVHHVTSVSNLCSKLHFSGTLGNVFVLNLFSSCIYYNTRFPICQVLFLADHRGLEPLLSDLESDVLPLTLMACGRDDRARTCDLMLPKHVRYQLRHSPMADVVGFEPTLTGLESVVLPLTLYAYT